MSIQSYQDLIAWQKAVDLVDEVYRMARGFPREELYGDIRDAPRGCGRSEQHREGQGRKTRGEFLQFLGIARGSLFELDTQAVVAARIGYISRDASEGLRSEIHEVGRILSGLMTSLETPIHRN